MIRPDTSAFVPNIFASLSTPSTWRRAAATTALSAALLLTPASHSFAVAVEPVAPDAEHQATDEAWTLINDYYLDPTFNHIDWKKERQELLNSPFPDQRAAYKALRRSVSKLGDRYTRILSPDQMRALRKYDVSGVGLLLTSDAFGRLIVATDPDPDTSAGAAGVKRGDEVVAVDGRFVKGAGAFEVAGWMQGTDGTELKIQFRDMGETRLVRHFTVEDNGRSVTRVAVIDRPDGKMGYIRLGEFRASGRSEVANAMKQLKEDGADWLVIDLRDNGGGVFEGALEIAGLLEGDGLTVARVSARENVDGGIQEAYKSRTVKGEEGFEGTDVAILMNGFSASSSEVLAGGLRDTCHAALVGDRSYGKGVIQGVFGLSDGGGVAVTVAEYRTPRGVQINGVGLKPDIPLDRSVVDTVLKGIGLERIDETTFNISREAVKDVLKACKVQDEEIA